MLWHQAVSPSDHKVECGGEEAGIMASVLPTGWQADCCCGAGPGSERSELGVHLVSRRGSFRSADVMANDWLVQAMILITSTGNSAS